MKLLIFFFLLFLLTNSVLAVSVAHPKTEFFYEPGKKIEFPLIISNAQDTQKTVQVETNAGKLSEYVIFPAEKIELEPKEQKTLTVKISLPRTLQQGLYPISIRILEGQGMTRTGVETVIEIVNPYNLGYPSAKLTSDLTNEKIHTVITVRNIGKTPYSLFSKLLLKEDDAILNEIPIEMIVPPLQTEYTINDIPVQLKEGDYHIELNLPEQQLIRNVRVGKPKIKVEDIKLIANQENNFLLSVNLDWNTPITTTAAIYAIKNQGGELFKKEIDITIRPGENKIPITLQIPRVARGEYTTIFAASNQFQTKFITEIDSEIEPQVISGKATGNTGKGKTLTEIALLTCIATFLLLLIAIISRKNETPKI